jgi:ribosomal-protein-alanine N-acetyltransferase
MLLQHFTQFPELQTERLLLRKTLPADAANVQKLRSGDELKYLPHLSEKSVEEHAEWIDRINAMIDRKEALGWAITLKDQPEQLLGTFSFWNIDESAKRAEIGYHLFSDLQRKGIMSEALAAVIDLSRSIGLTSLQAFTLPYNEPSLMLLKKLGFIHDHTAEAALPESELHGNVIYTLHL